MQIHTVEAGRGAGWLGDGFDYFKRAAGAWLAIAVVLFVIYVALSFIPVIGSLAGQLLAPVFSAGILLGCRQMDDGGALELGHLFKAFSDNPGPLIVLGALYVAALIALGIFMVILAFFVMGGVGTIMQVINGDANALLQNLPRLLVVMLVGVGLYVPVVMAFWFAPALVALGGLSVQDAVSGSFTGCMRNLFPFLVWGIVALVLGIVAVIPMGLGLLVLVPMIWASTYVAYKEIFVPAAS
jgi:uncharacterized membrane protein